MFPFAQLPEPLPELRQAPSLQGQQLRIDGLELRSSWQWEGLNRSQPDQLWLPLELLESHLGFRRHQGQLEWFGRRQPLAELPQRTLGDEVGLEVADWLAQVGVIIRLDDHQLQLTLPAADLQGMRRGKGSTADRLVLDLDGPALVQRVGDDLHLGVRSTAAQQLELRRLRLIPQQGPNSLVLKGQATRLRTLSLATPLARGARWRTDWRSCSDCGPASPQQPGNCSLAAPRPGARGTHRHRGRQAAAGAQNRR